MKYILTQLFLSFIFVLLTIFSAQTPVFAQNENPFKEGIGTAGEVDSTLQSIGDETASSFLSKAINFLLSLVALLALAALIWGGIAYILSLGNDQRAETAKKIILYAVVGLLITGVSFFIIKFIQQFLTGESS